MLKYKHLILYFIIISITSFSFALKVEKFNINMNKCIGCGLCVQLLECPTNAIYFKNGKAYIDQDKCIDCGFCKYGLYDYQGCPVNAIESTFIEEKEQSNDQPILPEKQNTPITPTKPEKPTVQINKSNIVLPNQREEKLPPSALQANTTDTSKPVATNSTSLEEIEKPETKTIEKKKIYFIDKNTCIGCRLCVRVCEYGAISMVKGKAVIDLEKCQACGTCFEGSKEIRFAGCPVSAIKVSE
ncbi:MAG TPA: 4Fe-4S binding protein [Candidatus Cloacimonadota bacterium]|jgi:ferredoxin|nr:4Fe-4S binding protein [Candidatus Cloacimonadales bacterium]HOE91821.1 4Fe-4S binding protein [Candidatus Cloacimonadota bacterium]HOQ80900.1 4Fe-4S binding protein [Candidatus Cloacimonadota bacterium]HPY96161.1 4Fe-4S binding protein [Candidatus Cloacimonadota bacterium]HQB41329.1 4Fe-4S binding protein [Candidatus Cloacimonadota bacterium]